jgi:hypothetical protein
MKNKKKYVRKDEKPPGKEKAPKPRPAPAPAKPASDDDATGGPEEREADDKVIAPDGEPVLKKKLAPHF